MVVRAAAFSCDLFKGLPASFFFFSSNLSNVAEGVPRKLRIPTLLDSPFDI